MKSASVHKTVVQLMSAICKTGSSVVLRDLPESYFINENEKDFFHWLRDFYTQHRAFPQPSTVARELGIALLRCKEPVSYYQEAVRKRALYYKISSVVGGLQIALSNKDPDAAVDVARDILLERNRMDMTGGASVELPDALDGVLDDFALARGNSALRGITTGWGPLDAATDGWQNGDLITLVGRPGRGKTFLLLKQAHAAWNAGKSVLFVSMEMTDLQIARRFVGLHTGYNPNFLKLGQLSSDIVPRLHQQVDEMKRGAPFTMVAGNFKKSVESVRGLAEQLCPDIIYVDASYLLSPEKKRQGSSGRRESVSDVVEELASLAKSFNRPVVQTVQFNRNAERSRVRGDDEDSDKNPLSHLSLAKIGETDVIGQTSSVVLGIELGDRPHEATQRYLGILKGREGEQGHWKINYRFSPVDLSIITETEEQTIDVDVMV